MPAMEETNKQKKVDRAPAQYPIDIFERAWLVDTVQRLTVLDYLYRHLKEEGVSWGKDNPIPDVDESSMTLRLLRLHGYPITPDVLNNFKDKDGNFFCYSGQTHSGVSDMFNMYRFSQVRFPGETILIEAQTFAEGHLRSCMKLKHFDDKWAVKKAFHKEVEYSLNNPWKKSLQRLEVREYIQNYGENDVWISKTLYTLYNINNSKYLEMAKLDYNWLLTIYRRERQDINGWRKTAGFNYPFFERSTVEEIHSSIAGTMHEPEFSECRIAYTKCNYIENIIQDLYMIHESVEDLRALSQAVAKWNPAAVNHLPERLKAAYKLMYNAIREVATLATTAQARDMFPYLLNLRARQVEAYLRQREECDRKQGEKIFGRRSMTIKLSSFIKLLPNGIGIVTNKDYGSIPALFKSYTVGRKSSEQEVQDHTTTLVDNAFDELTHEYLKPSEVPYSCRRFMFEHARITWFFRTNNPSTIKREIGLRGSPLSPTIGGSKTPRPTFLRLQWFEFEPSCDGLNRSMSTSSVTGVTPTAKVDGVLTISGSPLSLYKRNGIE
ncbi:hypothetical protein H6P81_014913 [Aristolochia fimbriata]|uniref:Uncharacterized protein n=1 Tax=Aristolochia fimbriata TaxID=158543 RepID=A0AAV7E405_ARIFI|nr:hypothetical protein H6P81_014913 [Aristolochia fimbriata]